MSSTNTCADAAARTAMAAISAETGLPKGGTKAREHAVTAPSGRRHVLPSGHGELAEQVFFRLGERRGRLDQHVYEEVTTAPAPQVRHSLAPDALDVAMLGPCLDRHGMGALQRVHL